MHEAEIGCGPGKCLCVGSRFKGYIRLIYTEALHIDEHAPCTDTTRATLQTAMVAILHLAAIRMARRQARPRAMEVALIRGPAILLRGQVGIPEPLDIHTEAWRLLHQDVL